MILQDEFRENGYRDILPGNNSESYGIDLNDLYDTDQKPEELLGIFISKHKEELYFLLNGDIMEINSLCEKWDDRIRCFSIINRSNREMHKLLYNIILLVVCSETKCDKSKESNLIMSRKIIINGDLTNKDGIKIADDEAIGLPFYLILENDFQPDEKVTMELNRLLPKNEEVLSIMKTSPDKRKKEKSDRYFEEQEYQMIKGWLENDYSESENGKL